MNNYNLDEISLVDAIMFNVINSKLKFIKHIQNKFFGGDDVIMTSDFPFSKIVGSFKISKKMLMH